MVASLDARRCAPRVLSLSLLHARPAGGASRPASLSPSGATTTKTPCCVCSSSPEANHALLSTVPNHERRTFAAMLLLLDEAVLNATRALGRAGLAEDTLLIVASDNGAIPFVSSAESSAGSNYPLRGLKGYNWEGGNRVPAFLHYAGKMPARVQARQISLVSNRARLDVSRAFVRAGGVGRVRRRERR